MQKPEDGPVNPRELAEAYLRALQGQEDADAVTTEDITFRLNGVDLPPGRGTIAMRRAAIAEAFTDATWSVEDCVADESTTSFRYRGAGVHTGVVRLMGQELPPSGKPFEYRGMSFLTVRDGRVAAEDSMANLLDVLRQRGEGASGSSGDRRVEYRLEAGEDVTEEQARLRAGAGARDQASRDVVDRLGIAHGWRVLEVGAGSGEFARWLSERVSPDGRVVATDLDTRMLESLGLANLEARQHNIETDDMPSGPFDLALARLVMQHLGDPLSAAKKLQGTLRPGGWLFLDDGRIQAAPSIVSWGHPDEQFFNDVLRRTQSVVDRWFAESGRVGGAVAYQLPSILEQAGFVDVDAEYEPKFAWGGNPEAEFLILTSIRMKGTLVPDAMSEQEHERFLQLLADPAFKFLISMQVRAWGRKPED